MKKIITIVFAVLLAIGLQAQAPARVPAYQGLIERVQPNGDTLRTYLRGDERSHYMMTPKTDGRLAKTRKDGSDTPSETAKASWLPVAAKRATPKTAANARKDG